MLSLTRQDTPIGDDGYFIAFDTTISPTALRMEQINMNNLNVLKRKEIEASSLVVSQFDKIGADTDPTLIIVGENFYIAADTDLNSLHTRSLPESNNYRHLSIRIGTYSYIVTKYL